MSAHSMLRVHEIRESVAKTAKMLAQESVSVTQRGAKAYCTWDSKGNLIGINLPVIPDDPKPEFLVALQGFLDHEVAHALFTDSKYARPKAEGKKEDPLEVLTNAVEDCRIERKMSDRFPGAALNLHSLRQFLIKETFAKDTQALRDDKSTPDHMKEQTLMGMNVVPYLRARSGQKECQEYLEEYGLEEMFKKVDEALPTLGKRLRTMKTSKDAREIATDIKAVLMNEDPPSGGKGDPDDGEGDSGESEGEGSGKGKGKGKKSEKNEKPKDKSEKSESEGEDKDEGESEGETGGDPSEDESEDEGSGEGSGEDESEEAEAGGNLKKGSGGGKGAPKDPIFIDMNAIRDTDELAEQALEKMLKGAYSKTLQTDFTKDLDDISPYRVPAGVKIDTTAHEESVKKATGALQQELKRLIVARSQSFHVPGFRSGRLNGPSLHRLSANDDRVFKRRHVSETKAVALELVVDLSGSMNSGSKLKTAMEAAWAFSQVLDGLKIKHEVVGFTTVPLFGYKDGGKGVDYGHEITDSKAQQKYTEEYQAFAKTVGGSGTVRYLNLWMPIFKGFEEGFTPLVRQRMAHQIKNKTRMHQNNDAAAIEAAGLRLLSRSEPRKIMIVLSDGSPCDTGVNHGVIGETMRSHIAKFEKAGMEIIGIGVQDSSVKQFYKKNTVIQNVSELPGKLTSILKTALLG